MVHTLWDMWVNSFLHSPLSPGMLNNALLLWSPLKSFQKGVVFHDHFNTGWITTGWWNYYQSSHPHLVTLSASKATASRQAPTRKGGGGASLRRRPPVSERCWCSCHSSHRAAPPPRSRWSTWSLGTSPGWCSAAVAGDPFSQKTLSAQDVQKQR